jgi:hypothetical protein
MFIYSVRQNAFKRLVKGKSLQIRVGENAIHTTFLDKIQITFNR